MKRVTISDVENSVGFEIDAETKASILKENLAYSILDKDNYERYLLEYLKVLDANISRSGEHRKNDWENGWNENLEAFLKTKDIKSLIPRYHTKSNIARLNNQIIKTYDSEFDFKFHSFVVDSIVKKYGADLIKNSGPLFKICEFGCGTGYHLFRIAKFFPETNLVGLDWSQSSQRLISEVSSFSNAKVSGRNFNYFAPDESFEINGNLILTIASLEQIGDKHQMFVDYLLSKNPGLCIHFEPVSEVLSKEDNLLDYLTVKYFEKRNYLKGFLTNLKNLEKEGKAKILETRRLNYGSKFIEGHSLVIWKPI